MDKRTVRRLFSKLRAERPEPRGELAWRSPFELLVAVVLSAQATDKSVNQATRELFRVARTPEQIVALGEAGLIPYIRHIGLYNSKARHIVAAARMLLEEYGGEVPRDRKALMRLPGVGRKSANVILNNAWGEEVIAVDTHVFRVANRTGLAPGRTPEAVEAGLMRVVPKEFLRDAHHWLILHGRYTCTARRPRCPACAIRAECRWPEKEAAAG
ncbi:MAG: endonuclease III [Nitrospirae bacterium]|nr:MAG: endonuclease III [Nitrospirota bacterium]